MLPQGHFDRNNGDRSGIRTLDLFFENFVSINRDNKIKLDQDPSPFVSSLGILFLGSFSNSVLSWAISKSSSDISLFLRL